MSFSASISTIRIGLAAALAAGFIAAAASPAVAGVPETVIVIGAVRDNTSVSSGESIADRSIPMLPVEYDTSSSGGK